MARKVLITAGASAIGLEVVRAFHALGDSTTRLVVDQAKCDVLVPPSN